MGTLRRVKKISRGSGSNSRGTLAKQNNDEIKDGKFSCRQSLRKFLPHTTVVTLVIIMSVVLMTNPTVMQELTREQKSAPIQQKESTVDPKAALREKYENCTISFVPLPPRKEDEWRKPLWIPSFPGSGSASPSKKGDIVKELIDGLTGLKQGTKNYHMSMRGGKLKRCKGISETAGCSNGHPYVGVGPDTQTANFQSQVVFVIRNLADAIPALHTEKHIAYHNGKGQAPEHQWNKVRDEYLTGNIQSWKEMLQWWNTASYYNVSIYLPWEWLLSPTKGPKTVQRLADVYASAGFDVAPATDIPCIWYQVVQREWKRQEKLMQYQPSYTRTQQEELVAALDQLILEYPANEHLLSILQEYRQTVREDLRIESNTSGETVGAPATKS